MYGDFSRLKQPISSYSGVYMQQGRVQLDADWNAQLQIQEYLRRSYTKDMLGYSGTPQGHEGFRVTASGENLQLHKGHYYIGGLLCENHATSALSDINPLPGQSGFYLAYLDVWEESVSWVEDPALREKALEGADTALRSQVVWQVRLLKLASVAVSKEIIWDEHLHLVLKNAWNAEDIREEVLHEDIVTDVRVSFDRWQELQHPHHRGLLALKVTQDGPALDNRLYRIEIHHPGAAIQWPRPSGIKHFHVQTLEENQLILSNFKKGEWQEGEFIEIFDEHTDKKGSPGILAVVDEINAAAYALHVTPLHDEVALSSLPRIGLRVRKVASYKWSRNNGASITRVLAATGKVLTIDPVPGIKSHLLPGVWIELSTQTMRRQKRPGIMAQVMAVEGKHVTLDRTVESFVGEPMTLRIWDAGLSPLIADTWHGLEHGIEICGNNGSYNTYDFWTAPVRYFRHAEWPVTAERAPAFQGPQGIVHYHAPLALLLRKDNAWSAPSHLDMRHYFPSLTDINRRLDEICRLLEGPSHAIPKHYSIVGEKPEAPHGYRYTGSSLIGTCAKQGVPMPTRRKGFGVAVVEGRIYAIGGIGKEEIPLNVVEMFDPHTGQWVPCAPMITARKNLGVAVARGKIYAIGGEKEGTTPEDITSSIVEVYDPMLDDWQPCRSMPTARHSFGISVYNERIYVMGGSFLPRKGKYKNILDDFFHHGTRNEVYDPSDDTWESCSPLPVEREKFSLVMVRGALYAIGGTNKQGPMRECEAYSPEKDKWMACSSMPTARYDMAAVAWNNMIYTLGGYDGVYCRKTVEIFDPIYSTWREAEPLPHPRSGASACLNQDIIHLLGGKAEGNALTHHDEMLALQKKFYLFEYVG